MALVVKDLKLVFSQEQIQKRVSELAAQIEKDYNNEEIVIVCVLKGAIFFFADLVRQIHNDKIKLDTLRVSSYGDDVNSSGQVKFEKDLDLDIKGKHVLLVEDVIDTGITMLQVFEHLKLREAKSIKLAALIDKKERRETDIKIDYPGFVLNEGFIVGYGLDFAQQYRQLPAIYDATVVDE